MHSAIQGLQGQGQCYSLLFDVGRSGYRLWYVPVVGGLATIALGTVTELSGRGSKAGSPLARAAVWLTLSGVVSVVLLVSTFRQYANLRDALRQGTYLTVQGAAENFRAAVDGHFESFDVAGHHFAYASSFLTNAYNRSKPHGGLVMEGTHVRIADVGGEIARLEISCSEVTRSRQP